MTGGTDRPKTHLVFIEGVGFGVVTVAAFVHLWPGLWVLPLLVGAVLITLVSGRNTRALQPGTDQ